MNDRLEQLTREISPYFRPGFLQRENTVFQFLFEEDEPFYLTVTANDFSLKPDRATDPTMTLFLDGFETCASLLRGEADGMNAFMEGRYRADGNIVLSQLLLYLFKPDEPTPNIYEVQD